MSYRCPICKKADNKRFFTDKFREYFKCNECSLIFVPEKYFISIEDEKQRYDTHNNNPNDEGYRNFLCQLIDPLRERISKSDSILDFGSGPTNALATIMNQYGFNVQIYDPFYANDKSLLDSTYDIVISTEVVEHFRNPTKDWKLLETLVKPEGTLAIMTSLFHKDWDFKRFRYKDDETHLVFYSLETFDYLETQLKLKRYFQNGNVTFFRKTT